MKESNEGESPPDLQEEAQEPSVSALKLATLEAENDDLREKNDGLQRENDGLRYKLGLLRYEARMQVRAEDMNQVALDRPSFTISLARNGHALLLSQRLHIGADPNQQDTGGRPCIMDTALHGTPECARLLIAAGADVSFDYPETGNLLALVALAFRWSNEPFRKGDFVLTADLLVDAGAPLPTMRDALGQTNIDLLNERLNEYDAVGEDANRAEDCRALISIFTGDYWRKYGGRNPFLQCSTADEATWLLMAGAANTGDGGHVEMTRLRSIRPSFRRDVMAILDQALATQRAFVEILLTVERKPGGPSPFGLFSGHKESLLQKIADYLGVRGRMLRNVREAKAAFDELADGGVESEYVPGEWVHATGVRERNLSRRNAPE